MLKVSFLTIALIIMLTFALLPFFISEEIVREGLCVDGHGDVNLEGLKCDKSYTSYFGLNKQDSFSYAFLNIIGIFFSMGLVLIAVAMLLEGYDQ